MSLVQQAAPDFEAQAVMPDGTFHSVKLSDFRGKEVVLFFYPLDFTFVCPTEIIAFSERIADFEKRGVQVLGASVDSHYTHLAWRNTPRKEGGIGSINYPLVSDLRRDIATNFGVLTPGGVALRGLFLIDKEGIIRHELINDLPLGRSVDEALRIVDAWHYFEKNGEVCPANWREGQRTIKPSPEASKDFFEQEYSASS